MAGHHGPVRLDPALQKYYEYNQNRWRYFKWTPRAAFAATMFAGVVPTLTWYLFSRTEGKYNMRGKLRGDVIKEW